ncbi:MAG: methionine adenosyltransferase [Sporolactobacillus sp.]
MDTYDQTSESVTEGHPDKVCDQIADALLDAYIQKDRQAHVAIECMISKDLLVIAGEVRSQASIDLECIARGVIRSIGYDSRSKGFDADKSLVITNVNHQSADISAGVDHALDMKKGIHGAEKAKMGAGDQGTVYGYACRESPDFLPLPLYLAHRLARRLAEVRKTGSVPHLYPDGKSQVTVKYGSDGQPISIPTLVLSAQHDEKISEEQLKDYLIEQVIKQSIPAELLKDTDFLINPTGLFIIGGPMADTGLTGRKIIVDTYGGRIPHGGGAFSGKDPSKVDRSGAYMSRYAAKNIVAAGLAERCQIAVSYAIGVAEPLALTVETFGTEHIPIEALEVIVRNVFDFSPEGIIKKLQLLQPFYRSTAVYGPFRSGENYPWEQTDMAELLKKFICYA